MQFHVVNTLRLLLQLFGYDYVHALYHYYYILYYNTIHPFFFKETYELSEEQ